MEQEFHPPAPEPRLSREPMVYGFTPQEVVALASLASEHGLPAPLTRALRVHSATTGEPNTVGREPLIRLLSPTDPTLRAVVLDALGRIKRGSHRSQ